MKKILSIAIILLSLCSCDKWLEATSSTQFKADQIFQTKDGFLDALSGVYINMGDINSYGGAATWKYNDLVIYPYITIPGSSSVALFQQRLYDNVNVKPEIESIWKAFYNAIANVNMILANLDAHKDVFTNECEFNWVKGECLALRAWLHFDLMRMFGLPGWSGDNASKLTIPYAMAYSSTAVSQLSYSETAELLLSDINAAIELLKDDPVTGVFPANFDTAINADGYWSNRCYHLNLYAVKGLLARAYLWDNQYDNAARTAQEVIDASFKAGAVSWINCDDEIAKYTNDTKDWTFCSEHLFTLQVTGIYDKAASFLMPSSSGTANSFRYDSMALATFFLSTAEDLSGQEDMRGPAYLLSYIDGGYASYKLYGTSSSYYRNRMPMMKISEMYYIIAEKAARENDSAAALSQLNTVRSHRGITHDLSEDSDVMQELAKEYFREFINEGQTFYWCKHDLLREYSSLCVGLTNYVFSKGNVAPLMYPYPDEEIYYGRKQEM